MADNFARLRAFARTEHDAFIDDLAGLSEQQWSAPTACPGWSVTDLAAHVANGLTNIAELVTNGLAGRDRPPAKLAGTDMIGVFRAEHARTAALGRVGMLAALRERAAAFYALIEPLTEEQAATICWFYRGPMPVSALVGIRAGDTVIHRADVRRAVGLGDWFSDHASSFVGASTMNRLGMFYRPEKLAGGGGVLRVEGVDGGRDIAFNTSGVQVAPSTGGHGATLRTDPGTATLLMRNVPTFTSVAPP